VTSLVGDYTNPILKPAAAEIVKKHGEMDISGAGSPDPTIQCWPEPEPPAPDMTGGTPQR
jgi:hypothetical protein